MVTRRHLLTGFPALAGIAALGTACSSGSSDGISVYSWRQEDKAGYTAIFKTFSAKNDGIKVTFEPYNSTDYNQILSTAIKSGDDLDVLQLRPYAGARDIIEQDVLAPVDDIPGVSKFPAETLNAVKGEDGKIYGVPLALNGQITMFNSDLLKKHDIAKPTTWDEFTAACTKLKSAGITPIAQSGKAAYLLTILYQAVSSGMLDDAFVKSVAAGTADFTSDQFTASVQRVLDLKDFFPQDFVGMADDEARAMFSGGQAGFYINGDYRIVPLKAAAKDLTIDYLPSFAPEGSDYRLSYAVDGAYAMASDSPHKDDCTKLLTYMATPEFGTAFSKSFGRMSAVPGTTPADDLHTRLTADINDHGLVNVLVDLGGGQPDPQSEFENAMQGVFSGQAQPATITSSLQKAYEARMKKAKG